MLPPGVGVGLLPSFHWKGNLSGKFGKHGLISIIDKYLTLRPFFLYVHAFEKA